MLITTITIMVTATASRCLHPIFLARILNHGNLRWPRQCLTSVRVHNPRSQRYCRGRLVLHLSRRLVSNLLDKQALLSNASSQEMTTIVVRILLMSLLLLQYRNHLSFRPISILTFHHVRYCPYRPTYLISRCNGLPMGCTNYHR